MDSSSSFSQDNDDNNSIKDNALDEIKAEKNEEKFDLRKGFYLKKKTINEINDEGDNKEVLEEINNNDEQDFDYLKHIKVRKMSKIDYEKEFGDIYEINENYDEEEERKKKYNSKTKIIRLKIIRPSENADNIYNNIQLIDNSKFKIENSNINEKSFNKENDSPNKKNKIKENDNINNNDSIINHDISGEKNEINENVNTLEKTVINIKTENNINIVKKNTFKDNDLLGNKNSISSIEENQLNKKNTINESLDKKNNTKENDTLNKQNSIKDDNFSDSKSINNNESDENLKNSNKIKENLEKNINKEEIIDKEENIEGNKDKKEKIEVNKNKEEKIEVNKNKEENIEVNKNKEININKNESKHISNYLSPNIDKIKGNNKKTKSIGHYKNEKFYENELDNKTKENNRKDKNVYSNKELIKNDNLKLKNISKFFPLTSSSNNDIKQNQIKSNECKSFFTNKNNKKTKTKISLGDKTSKKVEPKKRKDLITTKIEGEKVKIKKFVNKGDYDYLNDNKKTKTKNEFKKLVNEFSKTRSQYQINNRSRGTNKNLNKTYIGRNQVKDNDKKETKTIRISKEKREKNGNRNVKNALRKNSSLTRRLSISQRNLNKSAYWKKKKNVNDNFSSKIVLKKNIKRNGDEKKSNIDNSSFYLRDKSSKFKNTINKSNFITTQHITALNAYTHLNRGRNENFRRKFNKNFLNQTAVYNNHLIEENKEIKENDDNKKYILNDSFINNNNDSFTQIPKSSKDINKLQNKNKNKNKMPISLKSKNGYIISKKKTDTSKMNKTFVK